MPIEILKTRSSVWMTFRYNAAIVEYEGKFREDHLRHHGDN
jgi:hypothetical protein